MYYGNLKYTTREKNAINSYVLIDYPVSTITNNMADHVSFISLATPSLMNFLKQIPDFPFNLKT